MVERLYRYRLRREGLILQIGDRFGEIAPLPGFSKETLEEATAEALNWIQEKIPPSLPSVRWGLECAQKDLQSVHLPLCALGPKKNFSTAKLKLGHLTIEEAIPFVKSHLPHFKLRLDCNRAWSLEQALTFVSHFAPSDFAYLEEPVQTFEELLQFSQLSGFPVAVDEHIHSNWSQVPTLKAVVVKPMIVGTIPFVPPHLDLVLSSSYESGLGLLHIANRAAPSVPIGLDTLFENDLLTQPICCKNGFFSWNQTHPLINLKKLCAL